VTIPESVLTMRIAVFEGCTSLTKLCCGPVESGVQQQPGWCFVRREPGHADRLSGREDWNLRRAR